MSPSLLVKLCSCRFKFIPLFSLVLCFSWDIHRVYTHNWKWVQGTGAEISLKGGAQRHLQGWEELLLPPALPTQQKGKRIPEQNWGALALHKKPPKKPPGASLCPSSKGAALTEQRMNKFNTINNKFNSINNKFNSINSILPLPCPASSSLQFHTALTWSCSCRKGWDGNGEQEEVTAMLALCLGTLCTVTLCTVTLIFQGSNTLLRAFN